MGVALKVILLTALYSWFLIFCLRVGVVAALPATIMYVLFIKELIND